MTQLFNLGAGSTINQKKFVDVIGAKPEDLFNKNLPHRINHCSFNRYLELFNSKRSFQEVADVLGVSRQAVGQTYKKYFLLLFPGCRSIRDWYRWRAIQTRQEALNKSEIKQPQGLLGRVWRMAVEAGLSVKRVIRRSGKSFLTRELIIGGKKCRIFYCCKAFKTIYNKGFYSRHRIASNNLQERKYDFLILFCAIQGYKEIAYVVPYSNILILCRFRSIKDSQGGEEIKLRAFYDFYMPLNDNRLHNGGWRGTVDLSGYKNAWYLMK